MKNPAVSRRDALRMLGGFGLLGLGVVACKATAQAALDPLACVARSALTEGPYFVDEKLNRSDIRADPSTGVVSAGVPLVLTFVTQKISGSSCTPLEGLTVDVWHADAAGTYSDVTQTVGKKYLRGYQTTDASGKAVFTTIFPGWYSGRAVHVHFKVRSAAGSAAGIDFTSQLFFDEAVLDAVYARAPYAARGAADVPNEDDSIYGEGGNELLLTPTVSGDGYAATIVLGLG